MKKYDYIIGCDPGLTGGISIFDKSGCIQVLSIPVMKAVINKKNKNIYDIKQIVKILKQFENKNVYFGIERQSSRMGEGSVSSFTNGTNYGLLQGIGHTMEFDVNIISPVTWKKYFPELITEKAIIMKEEKKENIKYQKIKKEELKNIKDKKPQKQYKKDIEILKEELKLLEKEGSKLQRLIKYDAKFQARKISAKMYPLFEKELTKVKDDGKADAILIGEYLNNTFNKD